MRSLVRVTVSFDKDVEMEVEHEPDEAASDLLEYERRTAVNLSGLPPCAYVSRVVYIGPVVEENP
jgi:hypothetical protein